MAGDAAGAVDHFKAALESPVNLGEAKHLLANQSSTHYWLGTALSALGDPASTASWQAAADVEGDFQVGPFSSSCCFV